jgi:hypothetical protein
MRFVQDGAQIQPIAAETIERKRHVEDILARFDAAPDIAPAFTDASLYHQQGLPGLKGRRLLVMAGRSPGYLRFGGGGRWPGHARP